jgi:hypothetical protein
MRLATRICALVCASAILSVLLSQTVFSQRTALAQRNGLNAGMLAYLPLVAKPVIAQPSPPPATGVRRVNAPYYTGDLDAQGLYTAIAWFGQVTSSRNYTDMRIGYTSTELYIRLLVFDRLICYNPNPASPTALTSFDSASIYVRLIGNSGNVPDNNTYRFDAQFSDWEDRGTGKFQAAYRGNGSGWSATAAPFTTSSFYQGDGPDCIVENRGWVIAYHIPFTSLGLTGQPVTGTQWGLGVALHDRDTLGAPTIADTNWPENLVVTQPSTYGQLAFGLPTYSVPSTRSRTTLSIRHGVNGAVVTDGEVGGGANCGDAVIYQVFDLWGNVTANTYAVQEPQQINIQNQQNVEDWPCFSKYYITFPLTPLPSGKAIISATLTLYQFGNAGQGWTPGPQPSLLQVLAIAEDWNPAIMTWNNAPLAKENFSRSWVDPISYIPPWPGIPRTFDVSRAVVDAYAAKQPLRLVLYSADGPMHSGKYFYSSNADLEGRPQLDIAFGDP